MSLGSFSKILAPGLRVGWAQAKPPLIQKFATAGVTVSGGGLNHFTATLIHAAIKRGMLRGNIAKLRREYAARMDAMRAALQTEFGNAARFAVPGGGYFVWTALDGADTDALLPIARERGVSYYPGSGFSTIGGFADTLRLSVSLYDEPRIAEGVRRLAAAYHAHTARRKA